MPKCHVLEGPLLNPFGCAIASAGPETSLKIIQLCRWTTGRRSEKGIVKVSRHYVNSTECTYRNLDGSAYCTPRLQGIPPSYTGMWFAIDRNITTQPTPTAKQHDSQTWRGSKESASFPLMSPCTLTTLTPVLNYFYQLSACPFNFP